MKSSDQQLNSFLTKPNKASVCKKTNKQACVLFLPPFCYLDYILLYSQQSIDSLKDFRIIMLAATHSSFFCYYWAYL